MRVAIAVLLIFFMPLSSLAAQRIDSVRLHRAPDHTRIVFDLQNPVEHKLDKLANPDRIVVDLLDAELDFDVSRLEYSTSPIRDIRVGRHADGKTRVVFDLKQSVRPRTNLLRPVNDIGWRLVVDLFDSEVEAVKSVSRSSGETGARRMVVAIDAGHGGEDPGARGPSGVHEKKIVLQIAQRLYNLMKNEPGMQPVMIRDGDYYVPLAERRRVAAEKHRADVFISIHADAFTNPQAHGASVFALSHRGATSAKAGYLARIANESDRVAGVYEEEKDSNGLLSVIADMTMNGSLTHSLYLGKLVLEQLGGVTDLHGSRTTVEQAGFAVLKEPSMVSILVETGFISNRKEEKLLRSSGHQEKIARSVLNGVRRYFETHPQPETWYAMQRHNGGNGAGRSYHIKPGDTLSSIARRHAVSEAALRQHNNLASDLIQVGQTLVIPGN